VIANDQSVQRLGHWTRWLKRILRPALVGISLLGLIGGFTTQLAGYGATAGWVWGGATLPVLVALLVQIGVSMWRGGGYAHSRFQEWVFGGLTRALLGHFPKCCLLSH